MRLKLVTLSATVALAFCSLSAHLMGRRIRFRGKQFRERRARYWKMVGSVLAQNALVAFMVLGLTPEKTFAIYLAVRAVLACMLRSHACPASYLAITHLKLALGAKRAPRQRL